MPTLFMLLKNVSGYLLIASFWITSEYLIFSVRLYRRQIKQELRSQTQSLSTLQRHLQSPSELSKLFDSLIFVYDKVSQRISNIQNHLIFIFKQIIISLIYYNITFYIIMKFEKTIFYLK